MKEMVHSERSNNIKNRHITKNSCPKKIKNMGTENMHKRKVVELSNSVSKQTAFLKYFVSY